MDNSWEQLPLECWFLVFDYLQPINSLATVSHFFHQSIEFYFQILFNKNSCAYLILTNQEELDSQILKSNYEKALRYQQLFNRCYQCQYRPMIKRLYDLQPYLSTIAYIELKNLDYETFKLQLKIANRDSKTTGTNLKEVEYLRSNSNTINIKSKDILQLKEILWYDSLIKLLYYACVTGSIKTIDIIYQEYHSREKESQEDYLHFDGLKICYYLSLYQHNIEPILINYRSSFGYLDDEYDQVWLSQNSKINALFGNSKNLQVLSTYLHVSFFIKRYCLIYLPLSELKAQEQIHPLFNNENHQDLSELIDFCSLSLEFGQPSFQYFWSVLPVHQRERNCLNFICSAVIGGNLTFIQEEIGKINPRLNYHRLFLLAAKYGRLNIIQYFLEQQIKLLDNLLNPNRFDFIDDIIFHGLELDNYGYDLMTGQYDLLANFYKENKSRGNDSQYKFQLSDGYQIVVTRNPSSIESSDNPLEGASILLNLYNANIISYDSSELEIILDNNQYYFNFFNYQDALKLAVKYRHLSTFEYLFEIYHQRSSDNNNQGNDFQFYLDLIQISIRGINNGAVDEVNEQIIKKILTMTMSVKSRIKLADFPSSQFYSLANEAGKYGYHSIKTLIEKSMWVTPIEKYLEE